MNSPSSLTWPLISVIIPCYNHGAYLMEALASVAQQEYPALEIVVVDDGSTDTTRAVAESYPGVRYFYQPNQGLSAARNAGAAHSTGRYLVFLDADDWLLPNALKTNVQYLQQDPVLAFVSGGHNKMFTEIGTVGHEAQAISGHHYYHLLHGNYIGMHAAVMYQRWVFEEFAYDPTLKTCEDYDLYLRITRTYPVAHHTQRIAAYRLHGTNMSGDTSLMLMSVLAVLTRQQGQLRTELEAQAYVAGQANWQAYYSTAPPVLSTIAKDEAPDESPAPLATSLVSPALSQLTGNIYKEMVKKNTPALGLHMLHKAGLYKAYQPAVGQVLTGDFERLTPFSSDFGFDRGGAIDRYYIEGFLQREAPSIRGRVLEIGNNSYTQQYGTAAVLRSDILHIDASNPRATFVGDLSAAPHVPDNTFDCLILTQTLHLIYDFKAALHTCYRILKPGGTLLLTVPGITPIDRGEWKETWYWSFTDKALHRLLAETFPVGIVELASFGNVWVAAAYLYGMGLPEINPEKLDYYDPQFQVITTVKAVKPLPIA